MAETWQPMTDEEFERGHRAAVQRGRERLAREPQALRANYEAVNGRFIVELNNGCTFIFPADKVQGLQGAAPELLAAGKPSPNGLGLHWNALDVHFSLAGLMAGIFGTAQWMADSAQPANQSKPQRQRDAA